MSVSLWYCALDTLEVHRYLLIWWVSSSFSFLFVGIVLCLTWLYSICFCPNDSKMYRELVIYPFLCSICNMWPLRTSLGRIAYMPIYNVARYDTPSPNAPTPIAPRIMRPMKANRYLKVLMGCLTRE